jgi:phosphoribosylanthranilate isomerase
MVCAMRTRLKVCCIASPEEARVAIAAGADALGLVAAMPTGPGPIADELMREIATGVPASVATFLLTSRDEPSAVVEHIRATGASTVQLVDDTLGEDVWNAIRQATQATRIVQVIHVRDERSIGRAMEAAEHVDTLLLDSGHPAKRELGGTGRVHDWVLSRKIVERSKVPVFLAGGLNASNVAEAMRSVQPFGIDLCSGVRTNGRLDAMKLRALVESMREADRERSVAAAPPT